jgi:outer membrane protein insertion porin family
MDEVPLSERYFLGGPRTVRGFKYRDVGPKATRDIVNPDGTVYTEYRPRGGQTLLLAGAEYGIPLGIPHIRLAGFFDIGSLAVDPYDLSCEELAWGSGIGIRLDIPGFPIRLDYTMASDVMTDRSRDETETERWSFFIGYGF